MIHNDGELTTVESTFILNMAKIFGGAIFNSGELSIAESELSKNTAKMTGGAVHNWQGVLTISESTLSNNITGHGGAINNAGELTILKSVLDENTARMHGGAIRNEGELSIAKSTLEESILTKNTALDGGAIYNSGDGVLTIIESKLNENIAQEYGGAIYLDKRTKKFESNNSIFKDNKPDDVYEQKD